MTLLAVSAKASTRSSASPGSSSRGSSGTSRVVAGSSRRTSIAYAAPVSSWLIAGPYAPRQVRGIGARPSGYHLGVLKSTTHRWLLVALGVGLVVGLAGVFGLDVLFDALAEHDPAQR